MNNTFSISKEYELNLDIDIKKNNGVYYTPKVIVDYIINKTIKNHNIIKNPNPKILDISCGCGNFLLEAYDTLYKLFEDNIEIKDIVTLLKKENIVFGGQLPESFKEELKQKEIKY